MQLSLLWLRWRFAKLFLIWILTTNIFFTILRFQLSFWWKVRVQIYVYPWKIKVDQTYWRSRFNNPDIENRHNSKCEMRREQRCSNLVLKKIYFICAAHKFATWAELCNSQVCAVTVASVCTCVNACSRVFVCHIYLFILFVSAGFCVSFLLFCSERGKKRVSTLWANRTCLLIFSLDGIKWWMCNLFYDEQCLSIWHTIHTSQLVHQQ